MHRHAPFALLLVCCAGALLGCASQDTLDAGPFHKEYLAIQSYNSLLIKSDAALQSGDYASCLAYLRSACAKRPGEPEVHWKMAVAAKAAGEREVGRRALLVMVSLNPDLAKQTAVTDLAESLAGLRGVTKFRFDAQEETIPADFTWSQFYKPARKENVLPGP